MLFVKANNFIEEKDRIVNLERVWLSDPEQRTAILNWALEGLVRLFSQKGFTKTKSQEQIEIEFMRNSDTVTAFQKERGIIDKNLTTTRGDARQAYDEYCEANGLLTVSDSVFTQGMKRLSPKVKDGKIRVNGKQERAWIGFGLKFLEGDDNENNESGTIGTDSTPNITRKILDNFSNIVEDKIGVPSVPSVPNLNQEIYKNRFCSVECSNYNKQPCPHFTRKLPKDQLLPLKCNGYVAIEGCV